MSTTTIHRMMTKALASSFALAALSGGANAAVAYYVGYDQGASSVGPLAATAAARFDAAVGAHSLIDFESALPASLTLAGGAVVGNFGCDPATCGFNTTVGGSMAYAGASNPVTFTFASPVSAFGAYFTGLDLANHIAFNDGTAQGTMIPGAFGIGGVAFVGFTDFGKSFSSVTITLREGQFGDRIGIDDVRFAAAVPEPGTWALMGLGLAGLGALRRRQVAASSAR